MLSETDRKAEQGDIKIIKENVFKHSKSNTMEAALLALSRGNPGALSFLTKLMFNNDEKVDSLLILGKIDRCRLIGTSLYVLYSDICNKNMELVAHVCKHTSDKDLIDACSKQDYSGRSILDKIPPFIVDKKSLFVPTTDNWHPNHANNLVELSYILHGNGSGVVCVWGADDFGLEFETTKEKAKELFDELSHLTNITQVYLISLGFKQA